MFEAAFLENDTDALAETSSTGLRVEPENRYGPRCGAPVAFEDFDQRCLASAVGTEKGKDFASPTAKLAPSTAAVAPYRLTRFSTTMTGAVLPGVALLARSGPSTMLARIDENPPAAVSCRSKA